MELDAIHQAMLDEIDDSYQKTPGFPAYDFTRAFALAALSLDGDVEAAENRLDPDLLTGEDLELYVWHHAGITRRHGASAEVMIKVVSGMGTIASGDLFATETGITFYSVYSQRINAGSAFLARASEPGEAGNVPAGSITVMPVQIPGIAAVTNQAASAGGADEESDEDLRERFYDAMRHPANGGNIYQYRQWAMSVDGVGRAEVFPTPEGPNTVEVCLRSTTGGAASAGLVAAVQALIDPNENGDGSGEAPIGAVCTVTSVTEYSVLVSAVIILKDGAVEETVQAAILASLGSVVRNASLSDGILRYSKVADALLVDGVADYNTLKVNNGTNTIIYGARQAPVLGTVTLTFTEEVLT